MYFSQFVGTFLLGKLCSPIYKRAAEKMCQDCEQFIEKGSKILDLGCGRGITAETFRNYFQAEILGADIGDQRVVDLPFQMINGRNLPFPDNSFDVVLISYVLHHAESPMELLKEAKRVSRDKIIVYEDLDEPGIAKFTCWLHKLTYKISAPFQGNSIEFYDEEGWEKLFNQIGMKTIFKKRVAPKFSWLYPASNILFVLKSN
jgi:ubiquinone/menaquinone biosynthesis C-methylase UbiE